MFGGSRVIYVLEHCPEDEKTLTLEEAQKKQEELKQHGAAKVAQAKEAYDAAMKKANEENEALMAQVTARYEAVRVCEQKKLNAVEAAVKKANDEIAQLVKGLEVKGLEPQVPEEPAAQLRL